MLWHSTFEKTLLFVRWLWHNQFDGKYIYFFTIVLKIVLSAWVGGQTKIGIIWSDTGWKWLKICKRKFEHEIVFVTKIKTKQFQVRKLYKNM